MSEFFSPSSLVFATLALLAASAPLSAQTISTFVAVAPCRVMDTRDPRGPFGGPSIQGNSIRSVDIPGSACGIPRGAVAYSLNISVVPQGGFLGFLRVWPNGQPMPQNLSTLNSYLGTVVANAAIVPAGSDGGIAMFVTNTTDVIIDINGYFAAQALPVIPTMPTIPNVVAQSTSGNTQNTAIGIGASSVGGALNTAIGANTLSANYNGSANTALGAGALASNSSGVDNTAVGANTMSNSASGYENTAVGSHGMESTTSGWGNSALGYSALSANTLGQSNTAVGANALSSNTSGIRNIGIGMNAGKNLTTGADNIDIANDGLGSDSGVIRLGSSNQNSIYVPAILNNSGGTLQVTINSSTGKLSVITSSRRYKEDIQDIGDVSSDLFKLRPVQFRYKQAADDGSKPLQYGLIAEEVESVYPQLVVHDKNGEVEGVQYQQLPAMLLNEMQKQQKTIARQQEDIQKLLQRVEALESQATGQSASEHLQ